MRDYVARLKARGDLLVVDKEIDPFHELAAVTHVAQKRWGKPILFTNVKGTRFPVVTNVYGTRERLAEVIGIDAKDFCRQWSNLANLSGAAGGMEPFTHVNEPDLVECKLSDLPLITYSDRDGGPYFTSAMFMAKDPETGIGNLSFHRSMYISDSELRCRLAPRHHLTIYHEKAERMGEPLEAAMLIGAPATSFLTAAAPLPYDVDELEVAARLKGSPIAMRKCKYIYMEVPADTEVVIEGRFLPNVRRPLGELPEMGPIRSNMRDNAARVDYISQERDVLGVVERLLAEAPSIGAIVSECANLPPYSAAIERRFGLPVYDIVTLVAWLHAGLRPRRFGLWSTDREAR